MYEPKYIPHLTQKQISLENVSFGINYVKAARISEGLELDPLHIHSGFELFFNVSKDVMFVVNEASYNVSAGEAVITRPNDIHVCVFPKSVISEHICLWIDAPIDSAIYSFLIEAFPYPLISFDSDVKTKLITQLSRLSELCNKNDAVNIEKTACFLQILALMKDHTKQSHGSDIPMPKLLKNIIEDINENFSSIHSVSELCDKYYVSSSTLTRWFEKYLHTSPKRYLELKKLSNAKQLLESGSSVTEACFLSGFADCSRFISLFKTRMGKTPFKYKKEL